MTDHPTITDRADRDALLRYLDLCNDVNKLINEYRDLGLMTVVTTLQEKALGAFAVAHLAGMSHEPPLPREPNE